ncbi:MAG: efflux RND transporter permease subunit, partial [Longimicrobiales bacterium]
MITASIRRPVAVSMAYLAVALLGVAAWRGIPLELLPDTELPRLSVHAEWVGASPETTEALLTSPLEAEIQKVQGVETIESVSGEANGAGTAEITIEFAEDTDMDFARLELSERLSSIEDELPPGVAGPYVQPFVPEEFEEQQQPFLSYSITGPYTLEALRAHLDERLVPEVREVRGVARIEIYGGRDRVLEIELDEARILALGLTPLEVRDRLSTLEYVKEAGAVFDAAGERRTLAIRLRAESVADILRLPLLMDGGRVVRVSDVATIHDTFEDATSYYRINGNPAVAFVVVREYGGNEIEIADRVKGAVEALAGAHPPGVRLILDRDRSEQIRAQLHDLRYRATISAIVIFAVLLLFLRSFRSTAIIFATIGFSILITLNLLYFAGLTLNVLTLMGLAMGFGLIVDNAIVVLENVYRRRRLGEPADVAAARGAREVVLPVLAATATTIVVLVPFVYLQGELRAYYVPLALAVGFALIASMAVAFSFIPALAAVALRARPGEGEGEGEGTRSARAGAGTGRPTYVRFYAALVGFTVRHPWVTIALTLICLGGSYHLFDTYVTRGVVWGRWGTGRDTYISITFEQPRGEELARTDELVRFFEAKLAELPEVERFVTRVYPRNAHIRVTFPDSLELTTVPVAIKERMYAYSHLFGGAEVRVYGYGPSFYGGGGSPPNYAISILGYNYETVREIAEGLGRRLQRFSRIRDVDTNSSGGWFNRDRATELVLTLNRPRLAMHDLTAARVSSFIGASLRGRTTSDRLRIDGEEVQLSVKLEGNRTLDVQQLDNLLIPSFSGGAVRLGEISSV